MIVISQFVLPFPCLHNDVLNELKVLDHGINKLVLCLSFATVYSVKFTDSTMVVSLCNLHCSHLTLKSVLIVMPSECRYGKSFFMSIISNIGCAPHWN